MEEEEKPSKSSLKRAHKSIQAFVQELLQAPDSHLQQLPLSDFVKDEIRQARDMKMGARKRQVGFISKCMAEEPVDAARDALEQLRQPASRANEMFHHIETMRDALLAGDDSIIEKLVTEQGADRGHLRGLVIAARRESARELPPKSARKLFRLIRLLVEADGSRMN